MKRAWIWFSSHGVLVLLLTAAVASLSVAAASRPLGWLSRETATLWATGFAAAGTLAAVWAALRTANDAAVREERTAKEATAREVRAKADADQIRHDAIRPILSARIAWTNVDPFLLCITVENWGLGTAVDMRVSIESGDSHENMRQYLETGSSLRLLDQIHVPPATQRPADPYVTVKYYHGGIELGTRFGIGFSYQDVLGWTFIMTSLVPLGGEGGISELDQDPAVKDQSTLIELAGPNRVKQDGEV